MCSGMRDDRRLWSPTESVWRRKEIEPVQVELTRKPRHWRNGHLKTTETVLAVAIDKLSSKSLELTIN
ncbi:hypothetical protein TNCV_4579041 [Trichonephila clavipes]|nr:hypothetical protein TNCV_4579041 [Trichonephila clavipes]